MAAVALGFGAVAMSYRRFAEVRTRFISHLRTAAPEMTVEGLTEAGLTVQILGVPVGVDLASLFRRRARGLSDAAWYDQIVAGLREHVPAPQTPPYPLVQDRILPLLKPAAYVEVFDHYPPTHRLVWRRLVPGVVITYVIASIHQLTVVTGAARERWGLAAEALHAVAMTNLRRETLRVIAELGGPRHVYEHTDAFDATRILVADLVVPRDVEDPLLAIPEETVLFVAPAAERARLAG
jgi:hypothetical protein